MHIAFWEYTEARGDMAINADAGGEDSTMNSAQLILAFTPALTMPASTLGKAEEVLPTSQLASHDFGADAD